MKYYLLILLIFPLIVGGLELRVIIKNRRRAHEKRKNARHFQHFKETTSPFGVRKIKVVCQDETFLKELVCAAFDIEWESLQREKLTDDTFLFNIFQERILSHAFPHFIYNNGLALLCST
jgi:hypothetical protein